MLSFNKNANQAGNKKGKMVAVTNPQFLKKLRQIDYLKVNQLYQAEDLLLLEYYYIRAKAKKDGVILLQPEFYAERLAETFITKNYLTAKKREQFRAYAIGEQFIDSEDCPLEGEYIYALLPDDRLYVAPLSKIRNHSHLIAGLPVKAVGHAYFKEGRLLTLSNNSGHYKPTPGNMIEGLKWFIENTENSFLFEDHSQFNKALPDFGIKHYIADNFVKHTENKTLPTALSQNDILLHIEKNIMELNTVANELDEPCERISNKLSSASNSDNSADEFDSVDEEKAESDDEMNEEKSSEQDEKKQSCYQMLEPTNEKENVDPALTIKNLNEKKNIESTTDLAPTTGVAYQYTGLCKAETHSRFKQIRSQWQAK